MNIKTEEEKKMSNDRFKFRAWDKENKVLHYNAECAYDSMNGNPPLMHDSFGALLDDDKFIIEQCTGLKDKNGKLIYENDIVQYNDQECGTVLFWEGCWVWDWKVNDPPLYLLEQHYLKIIGNIHEMENEND